MRSPARRLQARRGLTIRPGGEQAVVGWHDLLDVAWFSVGEWRLEGDAMTVRCVCGIFEMRARRGRGQEGGIGA